MPVQRRLVNSDEHDTKVETVRYSSFKLVGHWTGQYKKCVQYGFKFTPYSATVQIQADTAER